MRGKSMLDKLLERYLSRKLLVFVTATVMLPNGMLTGEQWVAISLAYIGSQGLADIATAWKSGVAIEREKQHE